MYMVIPSQNWNNYTEAVKNSIDKLKQNTKKYSNNPKEGKGNKHKTEWANKRNNKMVDLNSK